MARVPATQPKKTRVRVCFLIRGCCAAELRRTRPIFFLLCGCSAQPPTFWGPGHAAKKQNTGAFTILLRGCSAGELPGTWPLNKENTTSAFVLPRVCYSGKPQQESRRAAICFGPRLLSTMRSLKPSACSAVAEQHRWCDRAGKTTARARLFCLAVAQRHAFRGPGHAARKQARLGQQHSGDPNHTAKIKHGRSCLVSRTYSAKRNTTAIVLWHGRCA